MANEPTVATTRQGVTASREPTRNGPEYRADVDIYETDQELTLLADMAGTTADGVEVSYENGILTLRGRVEHRTPHDARPLLEEYGVGDFQRTFEIGESIDAARIAAELSDGVLTVHLPKAEAARPRKIQVQRR
jgi:HSP20 family protein